jgi:hypothetical protein
MLKNLILVLFAIILSVTANASITYVTGYEIKTSSLYYPTQAKEVWSVAKEKICENTYLKTVKDAYINVALTVEICDDVVEVELNWKEQVDSIVCRLLIDDEEMLFAAKAGYTQLSRYHKKWDKYKVNAHCFKVIES